MASESETEEIESVLPKHRASARGKAEKTSLTENQSFALWLHRLGYSTSAIASELDIEESSVYTHRTSGETNVEKAIHTYHEFVQPHEVTIMPQFADEMFAQQVWEGIKNANEEGTNEHRIAQFVGMNRHKGNGDRDFNQVQWGLWAELVFVPEGEPFSPAAFLIHQGGDLVSVMLINKGFLREFVSDWLAPADQRIGWNPGYNSNQDFWAVTGLFREDTDWIVDETELESVELFADDRYRNPTDEYYMTPGGRAMLDEPLADDIGERGKQTMYYEPSPEERAAIESGEYDMSNEVYDRILSSEATRLR